MKPSTTQTEKKPSNQLRKAVFGVSLFTIALMSAGPVLAQTVQQEVVPSKQSASVPGTSDAQTLPNGNSGSTTDNAVSKSDYKSLTLDLSPAKWIWYPGDRVLPNTFILFRRALDLKSKPRKATGWIHGESRYLLEVNGKRVQWGPAPNDPRWPEVDPLDLTDKLTAGENVIGTTVLYFGHGDSTWPMGRPGFIFKLEIEYEDGTKETVVSDNTTWHCHLSQAWEPGHHRRWFMGALQEDFDARLQPQGWTEKNFVENKDWLDPIVLPCAANLPIFANPTSDVYTGIHGPKKFMYGFQSTLQMDMRPRSQSMMRETWIGIPTLSEQHRIRWDRPIKEYFAVRPPKAYQAEKTTDVKSLGNGSWELELDPEHGRTLTFALEQQMVGWPAATIEAPAGTTIEIMTEDAHAIGGPAVMNTHKHKWARFTCREGVNRFQQFDFDCFRWMQIHLHPGHGKVVVSNVGILERQYPWPYEPRVVTSDKEIQRVLDASTNTLRNMAQETFVDGMSRERNQYGGTISFCRFPILMLAGENRQVARFLKSYIQGQTREGYLMDAWPSVDRVDRMSQRLLDATHCGAILDNGVRFSFDVWDYTSVRLRQETV
jgi:alpha-L-rhamnosidase